MQRGAGLVRADGLGRCRLLSRRCAINQVALIGNLTKDPELRHTQGGTAVASLRLAVNDRRKINDEWTDVPYYFDVIVWGKQAENCATYLTKGKKIGVSGKLTWREWEKDGNKRQAVEVNAFNVEFLTPRTDGESSYGSPADAAAAADFGAPSTSSDFGTGSQDDDIPF